MKEIILPTYDFDGYILSPNTPFLFKDTSTNHIVEVPAYQVDQNQALYFRSERYQFLENDVVASLQHFRDYYDDPRHGWPERFIKDTIQALHELRLAPSFNNYRNTLIEALLFAINTARAHSPDNVQRAVQVISNETLTSDEKKDQKEHIKEKYGLLLKENKISDKNIVSWYFEHIPSYIPVNNVHVCKQLGVDWHEKTADKKVQTIKRHYNRANSIIRKLHPEQPITDHILKKSFGDDTAGNIIAMAKYYAQEIDNNPRSSDKYRLYYANENKDYSDIKKELSTIIGWEKNQYVEENNILKIRLNLPSIAV